MLLRSPPRGRSASQTSKSFSLRVVIPGTRISFAEVPELVFVEGFPETEHLGIYHLDPANRVRPGDPFWRDGTELQRHEENGAGFWAPITAVELRAGGVTNNSPLPGITYDPATAKLTYDGTGGKGDVTVTLAAPGKAVGGGDELSNEFRIRILRPTVVWGEATDSADLLARLPAAARTNLGSALLVPVTTPTAWSFAPLADPSAGTDSNPCVIAILPRKDPTQGYTPALATEVDGAGNWLRDVFTDCEFDTVSPRPVSAVVGVGGRPIFRVHPITPNFVVDLANKRSPRMVGFNVPRVAGETRKHLRNVEIDGRMSVELGIVSTDTEALAFISHCRFHNAIMWNIDIGQAPADGKIAYGAGADGFSSNSQEGFTLEAPDWDSYTGTTGAREYIPLTSPLMHYFTNVEFDRWLGASLNHYVYLHSRPNAGLLVNNSRMLGGVGCSGYKSTRALHRVRNSYFHTKHDPANPAGGANLSKVLDFVSPSDTVIFNNDFVSYGGTNLVYMTSRNTVFANDGPAFPDQYLYKQDPAKYPSTNGWKRWWINYQTTDVQAPTAGNTHPGVSNKYVAVTGVELQLRTKDYGASWPADDEVGWRTILSVPAGSIGTVIGDHGSTGPLSPGYLVEAGLACRSGSSGWQGDFWAWLPNPAQHLYVTDPVAEESLSGGVGQLRLRRPSDGQLTRKRNWAQIQWWRADGYMVITSSREWTSAATTVTDPWARFGPRAFHPTEGQTYYTQLRAQGLDNPANPCLYKHFVSYNRFTNLQTGGCPFRNDGTLPQAAMSQGDGNLRFGSVPANYVSNGVSFLANNTFVGWTQSDMDHHNTVLDSNRWFRTYVAPYREDHDPEMTSTPGAASQWHKLCPPVSEGGPFGLDYRDPAYVAGTARLPEAQIIRQIAGVWLGDVDAYHTLTPAAGTTTVSRTDLALYPFFKL